MNMILDSSALLSGRFTSLPIGFGTVMITDEVRDEVSKGRPARLLDSLLDAGLIVVAPLDRTKAVDASKRTGDLQRLSNADLSVIALAIERGPAMVVTDDFGVQNVLSSLGIGFTSAGELGNRSIKEQRQWKPRCRGCGRFFEDSSIHECPICGSEVGPARSRERIR